MLRKMQGLAQRPELWLWALLVWIGLSCARSWHTPWARAAGTETLRWAVGIGLTLAAARGLGSLRRMTQALTLGLALLVGAIVAGGSHADGLVSGPYADHQLCASALLALLPFSLALTLAARGRFERDTAQFVGAAALACLALTGTRAAWAGAAAGAAVLSICWLRRTGPHSRLRPRLMLLGLLLGGAALAFGILIYGSGLNASLSARAATLGALEHDGSWQWRLLAWRGALDMIARRPWLGWGIGHYPAAHWRFAPLSHPLGAAQRPTLSDQAHDLYLQTAADIGLPGLALYLGALTAAARQAWRALRPAPMPQTNWPQRSWLMRDALLAACLSLLAAQWVDALASPSWQYAEVSLLFWLGLGAALAAARAPQHEESPRPLPAQRLAQACAAGSVAVFLAAQVLPVGLLSPAEAYAQPNGWTLYSLTLSPSNDKVMLPASYRSLSATVTYSMTAVYQYANGSGGVAYSAPMTFTNGSDCQYFETPGLSAFSGNILSISKADDPSPPGSSKTVTITGLLTDNSGTHSATASLTITNN